MIFEGHAMDAGKFKKRLLSLSQNELCADCLIAVLNELDMFAETVCCKNCAHAEKSIRFKDELNCPMWSAAVLNQYGYCHMWQQKEE